MILYGLTVSGNCYKVLLLLHQLKRDFRFIEINSIKGETKTQDFLAKNPNGKIPLLETTEGVFLPESNAILYYLAADSGLWPAYHLKRAQALQWMFFEQYSHEPYIAVNRSLIRFRGNPPEKREVMKENHERGMAALQVMEGHLKKSDFFAGQYSIADIALFAYTHVAPEGNYDLSHFPAIGKWLERVRNTENFIAMDHPAIRGPV